MSVTQKCEMLDCNSAATEYVMDKDAGGWAGYACTIHAEQFPIREPLKGERKMARTVEPTTSDYSEPASSDYRAPLHTGITGYADIIVQTTVHFESVEVMDAFCSWIAENSERRSAPTVVSDFLEAASKARGEAENIRANLSR